MSLRVSGGAFKGRTLTAPRGRYYRPLTGRVKQSLFGVLGARVVDAAVLDLFAGVGVFGVEALSRGAARATFVERDAGLAAALEENVRALGLEEASRVFVGDVFEYLEITRPAVPYDIIFLDPSYGQGLAFKTVGRLASWSGFGPATLGVAKTFKKEHFHGPPSLVCVEERAVGGDNIIIFASKGYNGGNR